MSVVAACVVLLEGGMYLHSHVPHMMGMRVRMLVSDRGVAMQLMYALRINFRIPCSQTFACDFAALSIRLLVFRQCFAHFHAEETWNVV